MSDHESNENTNTHDHHDDKPSYDDVNTPVVLMIGFASIMFTILTIALVQGIYNHWKTAVVDEVRNSQVDGRRQAMIDAQVEQLNANDKGRISIDEAMEKTLKDYSK